MEIDGDKVRRLRMRMALTQGELAERSGVTRDTIVKIETGARARAFPSTIRAIAETLGVTPVTIMTNPPEEEEE